MADTLSTVDNVYEGFWIDWSEGSKWGLTWTLGPTQSMILTNLLALFVTVSGVHLWTTFRFGFHQLGAYGDTDLSDQNLLEQQRILRNASPALTTARLILKQAWSCRQALGKWRFLRSYSIGLIAVIYAACFMVAEMFSNYAINVASVDGASPVLLRTGHCGIWNASYLSIVQYGQILNEGEFDMFVQYTEKGAHDVQLSFEYAQECHQGTDTNNYMSCNTLKAARLNWDIGEGSCPFDPQMCHKDSQVIVLDTGYIDSHNDLGINSEPQDRLKYRRLTTCAVLNDTGYVVDTTLPITEKSDLSSGTAHANYGSSSYRNTNWTYSYSDFASVYDNLTTGLILPRSLPYQLDVEQAWAPSDPPISTNDFDPIPVLAQKEADLVLLFLSFTGRYLSVVNDPWFSAHHAENFENSLSSLHMGYAQDIIIRTLGCTETHQFCTSDNLCTGSLGFDQVQLVNSFNAVLTPHQNVTFDRILRAVAASNLGSIVSNLALTTRSMRASNVTITGQTGRLLSTRLPDNQWTIELNYWHSIAMAQLQRTVAQWATGQIAAEPQYLVPPTEERDIWFCKNLMVPSLAYQSFCVVAIILIITIGSLVIFASMIIQLRNLNPKSLKKIDSTKTLKP